MFFYLVYAIILNGSVDLKTEVKVKSKLKQVIVVFLCFWKILLESRKP